MVAYYSQTATNNTYCTTTWTTWNSTATTSSVIDTWDNWVTVSRVGTGGQGGSVGRATAYHPPKPTPLTPEQQASEDKMREERRIAYAKKQEEEAAAKARARELLLEHLTEEQRESVRKNNMFVVEGSKSKKKYQIQTNIGVHGNIHELAACGKKQIANLCGQLRDSLIPSDDHIVAQMLMLKYNEEEFLKIANRSPRAA